MTTVVPAYDEERHLGGCLAALARQTYPANHFEIIVVDNGSTDATAEIARRHRARVVVEPRKRVARACQTGFEVVRAKVIAWKPGADSWLVKLLTLAVGGLVLRLAQRIE